jgi:hypothetical protein
MPENPTSPTDLPFDLRISLGENPREMGFRVFGSDSLYSLLQGYEEEDWGRNLMIVICFAFLSDFY